MAGLGLAGEEERILHCASCESVTERTEEAKRGISFGV